MIFHDLRSLEKGYFRNEVGQPGHTCLPNNLTDARSDDSTWWTCLGGWPELLPSRRAGRRLRIAMCCRSRLRDEQDCWFWSVCATGVRIPATRMVATLGCLDLFPSKKKGIYFFRSELQPGEKEKLRSIPDSNRGCRKIWRHRCRIRIRSDNRYTNEPSY